MLSQVDLRFAPVRFGSRRLLALPVEDHKPATFGHQDIPPSSLDLIDGILNAQQLIPARRYLSIRAHPHEATAATVPTFVIETSCQNSNAETICVVMDQVQGILSLLLEEVVIEIIDSKWLSSLITGSIKASDIEALKNWDDCSESVVDFLCTQEREGVVGWTSIGLFRRGTSENPLECPVTILIGSPDADNVFWELEGYRRIADIASGAFAVEVMYSSSWATIDPESIDMKAYQAPLKMGASLGTAGLKQGGGTLGGFFEFQCVGEEGSKVYGITNDHVAVEEGTELSTEIDMRIALTPQTLPTHLKMPTLTSPAEDDHDRRKETLKSDRDIYAVQLRNAKASLQSLEDGLKEETAFLNKQSLHLRVSEFEALVNIRQEELDKVENYDINIGTLAAASGARLLEGREVGGDAVRKTDTRKNRMLPWLMDWAAIELDAKLAFENTVREPMHTKRTGGGTGSTRLKDGISANEYVILDPRKVSTEVAFRGRTSGWEFGEVNGVQSILNAFSSNKGKKKGVITGKYAVSKQRPGYSWAIVPRWGYQGRDACLPGDSGSVVLLDPAPAANDATASQSSLVADAKWVGLLFGHEYRSVAYMTPIEHVIRDIEATMKGKVLCPTQVHKSEDHK